MGLYDKGTFGGGNSANYHVDERENARDRFANALDQNAQAQKKATQAQLSAQDRMDYETAEEAPGAKAAKGAAMGMGFGPWGALIGGGIGLASGIVDSVGAKRAHGKGIGSALAESFLDLPTHTKGILNSPSTGGLTAGLARQQQGANRGMGLQAGMTGGGVNPNEALHPGSLSMDNQFGQGFDYGDFAGSGDASTGANIDNMDFQLGGGGGPSSDQMTADYRPLDEDWLKGT